VKPNSIHTTKVFVGVVTAAFVIGILFILYNRHVPVKDVVTYEASSSAASVSPGPTVATSSLTATALSFTTNASEYPPTYMHLVFDDEFNSFSRYVDSKGNITCKSGGTGTWQTVFNFCSRTEQGNYEAEVYEDPNAIAYLKKESIAAAENDPENPFSVNDGILSIKAIPADAQTTTAVGSWAKYTSGLITTQFSFSQIYGYFEIRAELPVGRGLWPAFWLLPEDGTWPPEIDAMEAFGNTNLLGQGGPTFIHYASHSTNSAEQCGDWHNTNINITQGFHTYGVDVEPTGITYYFDGKPYMKCKTNTDAAKPLYMLINLAVGSAKSWPGAPDSSTVFPAYLQVDYVRAYHN
jgi:beta-glucanase (GH16 family)